MKYYIIAGEASGDLHGANLLRALLSADADAEVRYWGGDLMAAALAEHPTVKAVQVRHIRDLAYMGVAEVVAHQGTVLGNIKYCKQDIETFRPDVMVFIDYPGFNLKIAKYTHQLGIRNLYYISPQIWAWKKRRIRPMRRDLDRLCYILPTEQRFYAENSFDGAVYVGHPLLDEIARYRQSAAAAAPDAEGSDSGIIALLPGSRRQEIKRLLPLMVEVARRHPDRHFVVTGMSLIGDDFYRRLIPATLPNIEVLFDSTYDVLSRAHAALVCSGTATLETALFRVPQVVCYRTSRMTALAGHILISKRIRFISLVNLIADRKVVTELIQDDCNLQRLEDELQQLLPSGTARDSMLQAYDDVAAQLGGIGASQRTVQQILSLATKTK